MMKKVAIVGSGCSGIGALWALKSTEHEVHLFESASRLGGHTNTVEYECPSGEKVNVDTGFIVMNTATYRQLFPSRAETKAHVLLANFIAFLNHLGVQTAKTPMTFGVSRDQGKFEWAGTSLSSIFAQRWNLLSPRMWKLILDIIRFNEFALDLLQQEDESEENPAMNVKIKQRPRPIQESIGDYLDREGYSQTFRDDYLIPMTAAVWSTSPDKCSLHFPAITLVRFLWNHHLLTTVAKRPDWMTIPGGSQQYIDAVLQDFPSNCIHLKSTVSNVRSSSTGSVTFTANGEDLEFDHVILATHGDQALDIIRSSASREEIDILGGFQTSRNIAVLHSDLSLMPKKRIAWSSWNYITESPFPPNGSGNISKVCLTYWMNLLQHIPEKIYGPIFVTLNPLFMPDPRTAQGIWEYSHPLYNANAIKAQTLLPRIQNTRNISFCGAWTKYGFHEDGFSSGLSVAINHLGASLPFDFVDSTFSRGRRPILTWKNYLARILILAIHVVILLLERTLDMAITAVENLVSRKRKVT